MIENLMEPNFNMRSGNDNKSYRFINYERSYLVLIRWKRKRRDWRLVLNVPT